MIVTVARIQSLTEVTFDSQAARLSIVYTLAHRAAGGRQLRVCVEGQALRELVSEIRRLDALGDGALDGVAVERTDLDAT